MTDAPTFASRFYDRRFEAVTLALVGLFTTFEVVLILMRLGGHFSYTLDDPYIHLALADKIRAGHYGLNPGEAAAPSSSILYPFLLAAVGLLVPGQFGPLALGFAATLASSWLLCLILREVVALDDIPLAGFAALAASILLSLNLIGVELTGLEHSLHVAVTLACVLGAVRFLRTGQVAAWWWLSALAEPLIRYEGASLWIATVGLLLFGRRWRAASTLFATGLVFLAGFSLFLHSLGLPWLPSSVLIKSTVALNEGATAGAGLFGQVRDALVMNATSYGGARLTLLCLVLAVMAGAAIVDHDPARKRVRLGIALFALFASAAHFALGRFGWLSRYEVYVLALDAAALLIGFGPAVAARLRVAGPARVVIAALIPMAVMSGYVHTSLKSFLASGEIYGEQFQMHRFAVDFYKAPVAVNDLGRVAYRNPYYVLDLWGLGSEEARQSRRRDPSGFWMDELARKHEVGLAMIYASWFDHVPAAWHPVARLRLLDVRVGIVEPVVTFYATRPDADGTLARALEHFGRALPPGTSLDVLEPSGRGLEGGREGA